MSRTPQRVEIVVPVRTLVTISIFGGLVLLVVLSIGTLLSIFVAGVLALGLDPVVGALVRRGWKRGRAALFVFAALFAAVFAIVLVTAGPLWDQITEFVQSLPAYWDELHADRTGSRRSSRRATRTTRSVTCSRTSPPACPTRRPPSSASPAACSDRSCRS